MFRSPFSEFTKEDMTDKDRTEDGQGEPLKKESRHSAVTHSLNKHEDGGFTVHTPEEGLTHHDDYESAHQHMSQSVGEGDTFGVGEGKRAGSKPSVRSHANKNESGVDNSGM